MHNLIEGRLAGAEANLEGILRFVERHAARGPYVRIELRLCPHTTAGPSITTLRVALERWLRRRDMLPVAVSIRVDAGAAAGARGEHQVRLYLTDQRGPAEADFDPSGRAGESWWRRWLAGPWPARRGGQPARVGLVSETTPTLSPSEAWQLVLAATRAAAEREAERGRHGPWSGAQLVVQGADLENGFRPLALHQLGGAVAGTLRRMGHAVQEPFSLQGVRSASHIGEGTGLPVERDLEVKLMAARAPAPT